MIKCPNANCGFENPDGSKFCCACGTKLDIKQCCSSCGAELIEGAIFCPNCGVRITDPQTGAKTTTNISASSNENEIVHEQVEQDLPRAKRGLYEYFDIFRGLMPELRECPLAWEKIDDEWVVTQKDIFWCGCDYGKEGYLGNYKMAECGHRMWVDEEYKGEVRYYWQGNVRYMHTVDKFAYDGDYVDVRADIEENHKGKISGIIDACKSITIFSLINHDNVVGAKEYIKRNPSIVSSENPISPLLAAAMTGSVAMAKIFIDAGADINLASREFNSVTALIAAASQGDAVMAKYLLDNGAMAFATCENGDNPLHFAARSGNGVVCLKLLLQIPGMDVNLKNNDGKTALDLALATGAKQCVKFLRNAKNYIENTQQADYFSFEDIEKEIKLQNETEESERKNTECLIKILENEETIDGNDEVKRLLNEGADPNVHGSWGTSAILRVENDVDMLKFLVEKYVDINAKNSLGQTLLHLTKNAEIAKTLLENGADVNARDNTNATPLHLCGNVEVAKILVEHGADVNARDNNKNTPLHLCGNVEVAKILIEHGSGVNAANIDKYTPLWSCILSSGNINIIKILLEHGANVNERGKYGDTLLHVVVDPDIAKMLIKHGADVNAKKGGCTKDGYSECTPLHVVKNISIAKILLENGADVSAIAKKRVFNAGLHHTDLCHTPIALARNEGIKKLIMEYSDKQKGKGIWKLFYNKRC